MRTPEPVEPETCVRPARAVVKIARPREAWITLLGIVRRVRLGRLGDADGLCFPDEEGRVEGEESREVRLVLSE
jgi:hypothetical protein